MKTINLLSGLVLAGITVVSCNKSQFEPTTPLGASVKFKIQATTKIQPVSKNLSVGSSNLSPNSFAWDTCLMVISKIELEAEKEKGNRKESGIMANSMVRKDEGGNSDSGNDGNGKDGNNNDGNNKDGNNNDSSRVKFEWNGPKKVDLFNLNASIGGITLDTGTFNNLTIKIESFKADAGSSPLFYLTGDYTNSTGTVKRINVVINQDFELRINKPDTLKAGKDFTSIIKLNLVMLLSGITQTELDNAVLTNDKLVISSTLNVTLFDEILKNLHGSGESEIERD